MITLNNKKFAKNNKEFTESLFHEGGTCCGYYKITKRTIKLFNLHNELIGVVNKYGVLCNASKLENGKIWYCYADIDLIGNVSLSDMRKFCQDVSISSACEGDYETSYIYK